MRIALLFTCNLNSVYLGISYLLILSGINDAISRNRRQTATVIIVE